MTDGARKPSLWRCPRRWVIFALVCVAICVVFSLLPTTETDTLKGQQIGHWTSVLPPLLAVVVALCFQTLVWALVSAFVLGCILAFWPHLFTCVPLGIRDFIWINFREQFNLYIFGFLFSLVGMIHVCYRGGGIHALVTRISRVARGPRSTKVATVLAGLTIFFDDYSNTVVVGSAMRGLSDRWKVSREKLAYLVDSTSAPVAGLALLSTWIAFEVFLFGEAARGLGIEQGGYMIFATILPYRFYCWGTLMFVLLSSAMGRDFGPMYRAELRAAKEGKLVSDTARPLVREGGDALEPSPDRPQRWVNSVLPLAVVIFGGLGGILLLGRHKVLASGTAFSLLHLSDWRAAFGMVTNPYVTPGGAMKVLFLASLSAGIIAVVLVVSQRVLTFREAGQAYLRAIPTLGMAVFVLTMAWGMSKICTKGIHTDTYLIAVLGDRMPLSLLPLFVFLVASGMAFATGTSFGTMGVLIPVIFPLAYALGAYEPSQRILFWLSSAAILDGAIFGDHCSPISDTTVLSSISSGCDHIDHVVTQLPYALFVMACATVLGYLCVGAGMPGWIYFVIFPLVAVAVLLGIGRRVPTAQDGMAAAADSSARAMTRGQNLERSLP